MKIKAYPEFYRRVKTISNFLFSLSLCILIVIVIAQLLYILERSLTFRKDLSIDNHKVLSVASSGRSLQDNRRNNGITSIILRFASDSLAMTARAAEKPRYQASRIQQSYPYIINLQAGKGFTFWIKFKNKGSQTWLGTTPSSPLLRGNEITLKTSSNKKSPLYHPWWVSENQACQLKKTTSPGEIGLFKFAIQAPKYNGLYWEKFNLYKGSTLIPGGDIEIPVRVYGEKNIKAQKHRNIRTQKHKNQKTESWWQEINADLSQVQQDLSWTEPEIRVGLYYVDSEEIDDYLPIQINTLNNQSYEVRDKNNHLLLKQTAGELTEIDFDFDLKRYFIYINGQRRLSTDSYLRFLTPKPTSPESPFSGLGNTIFQIPSLQNNIFWGAPVNDNRYRGELEIRYNPNTGRLWIINELPMEDYLKGVVEVSDSSHKELLKAQMIAARTYAMFRKIIPKYANTPDKSNLFTVRSTQADQVYRGYGGETRNPRTVKAIKETKGIMVFYQGNIAKTYYFAQTDGRTRDCQNVRMCRDFTPYLVSRNDPPGRGKKMRGHGVGMPQVGAREAANQGANFLQILKYYYPGVELKKVY